MPTFQSPHRPRRRWAAEIDGKPVADAAGLTLLWELLHKRWPKQMSRRTLAGIKN